VGDPEDDDEPPVGSSGGGESGGGGGDSDMEDSGVFFPAEWNGQKSLVVFGLTVCGRLLRSEISVIESRTC